MYKSTDNGKSWVLDVQGLTNPYIETLAVRGTEVYVGSHGNGVFFNGVITEVKHDEPGTMSIYPNPAHDKITISLSGMAEPVDGHLSLVDVTGRPMLSLPVIGRQSSEHDISQLLPGIYIIHGMVGNQRYSFRLIKR